MALKAVKITLDNRKMLEERYDLPPFEINDYMDFYLVAEFGERARPEGYVGETALDEMYIRGGALKNGFFEIRRR